MKLVQFFNGLHTYGSQGSATRNFVPASIRALVKVHFASSIITTSYRAFRSETWDMNIKESFFFFNVNKYDPHMTWDKVLLRKIGNTIHEIVDTNDISDHYMDNYLLRLKTLADYTGWHAQ